MSRFFYCVVYVLKCAEAIAGMALGLSILLLFVVLVFHDSDDDEVADRLSRLLLLRMVFITLGMAVGVLLYWYFANYLLQLKMGGL